ncbi:MAG: methylated-DNA--[protein]-cysteine S-methyltransferase [Thermomicrobiales bacterium]
MKVHIDVCPSPIGDIQIAMSLTEEVAGVWVSPTPPGRSFDQRLRRLGFSPERRGFVSDSVAEQFDTYFAGRTDQFDLPLLRQGTAFDQAVWSELDHIPFGETRTYKELAGNIGFPGDAQRVGAACAANPWLIVVPCHRVIASDGSLRGYAAGLHIKKQLLALERGQHSLTLSA